MELKLADQWKQRIELRAEAEKLWVEGNKLWVECDSRRVEGYKLMAEANRLMAEANKLWADAILEAYGNIKLEWKDYDCILENGERYKHEDSK
jgi:hypothetical protein